MSRSKKTNAGPSIPNVGPGVSKATTPVRIWPRYMDAALVERIAEHISRGRSCEIAGLGNGLSRATVSSWLVRFEGVADDPEPSESDVEFATAFEPIARALAEYYGGSEEMAAAGHAGRMWMLARRLQSVYGQKSEVALTTTVKPVSEDETRAMLGAVTTAADQPEDG